MKLIKTYAGTYTHVQGSLSKETHELFTLCGFTHTSILAAVIDFRSDQQDHFDANCDIFRHHLPVST